MTGTATIRISARIENVMNLRTEHPFTVFTGFQSG
jgi:hypothetical protein